MPRRHCSPIVLPLRCSPINDATCFPSNSQKLSIRSCSCLTRISHLSEVLRLECTNPSTGSAHILRGFRPHRSNLTSEHAIQRNIVGRVATFLGSFKLHRPRYETRVVVVVVVGLGGRDTSFSDPGGLETRGLGMYPTPGSDDDARSFRVNKNRPVWSPSRERIACCFVEDLCSTAMFPSLRAGVIPWPFAFNQ